jgi:uncharacterized protein YlxW (UPF0749 family)
MILNPKNKQEATALLTLRCDTLRSINKERQQLLDEIDILNKFIKQCSDKQQLDTFSYE